MVQSQYTSKHYLALCALFVLGNAVITVPTNSADQYNFLAFLLSFFVAQTVYFLFYFSPKNKAFVVAVWVLAIYCIGDAFVNFISFISDNLLPQTPPVLIAASFAMLVIYCAIKTQNILKFSFIAVFIVSAVVLLFFFSTFKDFNVENIFIYNFPSIEQTGQQLLPYLKTVALPIGLLAVYARANCFSKKTGFFGVGIGFMLLGICLLNTVLLFGISLSSRLDFPYSSVGSTVTFGNLFTRLDGLLYFVYLATSLVKCVVAISVIKKSRNILP